MSDRVSRRGFFVLAAAAVGAVAQDTTSVGRVYDPGRAGRALPPVTAADNDAGIQAIEKRARVLRRWTREAPHPATAPSSTPAASPTELEQLRRELDRFNA